MGKRYPVFKVSFILTIFVFAGAYFVWSTQETKEVSMCGFEITKEESIITITNGTVMKSGDIRIGASIGADNSFNLTFLDGTEERKFNVKECDVLEYKARLETLFVKVPKIYSNVSWWRTALGNNNASVELIIHKVDN